MMNLRTPKLKKFVLLRLPSKRVDFIPKKVVSPPKKVDSFPEIVAYPPNKKHPIPLKNLKHS